MRLIGCLELLYEVKTPLHSSLMSSSRHAAVLFHPAVYGCVVDAALIIQKETESGLVSGAKLHNLHVVALPLAACDCTLDTEDKTALCKRRRRQHRAPAAISHCWAVQQCNTNQHQFTHSQNTHLSYRHRKC